MSCMTKIKGVADVDDAIPGMAYFAGTGPAGRTCGSCVHRGYKRQPKYGRWDEKLQREVFRLYKVSSCALFRKFAGGQHGRPVAADNPACKCYEMIASPPQCKITGEPTSPARGRDSG